MSEANAPQNIYVVSMQTGLSAFRPIGQVPGPPPTTDANHEPMIPITQEIITGDAGDCLSACLASLLELPLDAVPKFRRDHGPSGMMPAARAWLADMSGLSLICISLKNISIEGLGAAPGLMCIAGGRSPEPGGLYHAVVGRIDADRFEMLHDPHPGARGIEGDPLALYFLVPVDPLR